MRVACFCGATYEFSYNGTCPECGSEVFLSVKPPRESATDFADRMSGFVKTGIQIASLPEVER